MGFLKCPTFDRGLVVQYSDERQPRPHFPHPKGCGEPWHFGGKMAPVSAEAAPRVAGVGFGATAQLEGAVAFLHIWRKNRN